MVVVATVLSILYCVYKPQIREKVAWVSGELEKKKADIEPKLKACTNISWSYFKSIVNTAISEMVLSMTIGAIAGSAFVFGLFLYGWSRVGGLSAGHIIFTYFFAEWDALCFFVIGAPALAGICAAAGSPRGAAPEAEGCFPSDRRGSVPPECC